MALLGPGSPRARGGKRDAVFDPRIAGTVALVGTGFVADFYMRSLATFPGLRVVGAFDRDPARLAAFCAHWTIPAAASLDDLLSDGPGCPELILNLTNPNSHFAVSRACLEAGKHVYSEKPLATAMADAFALCALARKKGLLLASAPCSVLGEAAQTAWLALRRQEVGAVRLVYAELDDDFVPQAPYRKWQSASGAPWPFRDEFQVGCTLEHAGYYLTWLMAMFGSVETVVSASANLLPGKLPDGASTGPDYSSATLFFASGVVARLTCSIVAPHDHRLRIMGDDGVLEVGQSWDNAAAVKVRRRHIIRRRLFNSPFAKRIRIKGATHPKVERWGATGMNFALGPADMIASLRTGRAPRLSADFALHLNEVTLAIQDAGGVQRMETKCPPIAPMTWADDR